MDWLIPLVSVGSVIVTAAVAVWRVMTALRVTIAEVRGHAQLVEANLRNLGRSVDLLRETIGALGTTLNSHAERIARLETRQDMP